MPRNPPDPMTLAEAIAQASDRLSPAERRIAEVVLAHPEAVAFGTVAELAARSGVSGPTVVRMARRLGWLGFSGLQDAVRTELSHRLRPAVERIRDRPADDLVGRSLHADIDNVQRSLGCIAADDLDRAVDRLSDRRASILVLASEASAGIGALLAWELGLLRPGVRALGCTDVSIARDLAGASTVDTVIAVDLRRYERWVVDTVARLPADGPGLIAVTDSALSPIAARAEVTFVVEAASPGPFDSHVGALAVVNVVVAAVASRIRRRATDRLDRVESAWNETGALVGRR